MTRSQLPFPHPTEFRHTCENLRALDGAHRTSPRSPLHHDRACPIHSGLLTSHPRDVDPLPTFEPVAPKRRAARARRSVVHA